ncbi:MAG: hypothetical protein U5K74_11235 [Gemmatimonadaceae bacterium]|nr:hypothetical protein [Gemmatimonadaceae bacterium]
MPAVAAAQNGSIVASATVRPRPLTLLGVARTATPGELRLRIDGCGSGSISVDSRMAGGATVRTVQVPLTAASGCGERSVTLSLAQHGGVGPGTFVVSLAQADAMLSPSFAQFVVPAASLESGPRTNLGY